MSNIKAKWQAVLTLTLIVCLYGLYFTAGANATVPDTTASDAVYVNQYFDVRNGQPVKYVFAGNQRVARVIGTLDGASERVQRLILTQGWNLVSIAVSSDHGIGNPYGILKVYRFDNISRDWVDIDTSLPLAQGDVLWLYAAEPSTIVLKGEYADSQLPDKQSGGVFYGSGSFEEVLVKVSTSSATVWFFDNSEKKWLMRSGGEAAMLSNAPETLGAGQAVFIQTEEPQEFISEVGSIDILYYHKDHLGSSSLVTDLKGDVSSEENYYPFGESRVQLNNSTLKANYSFIGKEQDDESGNFYIEARYYNPVLGRFLSVEPLIKNPISFIGEPSSGHQYAYSRSNPLTFIDTNGYQERGPEFFKTWGFMIQKADVRSIPKGTEGVVKYYDEKGNYAGKQIVGKTEEGKLYDITVDPKGNEEKNTSDYKKDLLINEGFSSDSTNPNYKAEKDKKVLEGKIAEMVEKKTTPTPTPNVNTGIAPGSNTPGKTPAIRKQQKARTATPSDNSVTMSIDDRSLEQAYVNQGVEGFETGMESLPGSGTCVEE